MAKMKRILVMLPVVVVATAYISIVIFNMHTVVKKSNGEASAAQETSQERGVIRWKGKVQHIFFHSLIVYPEKVKSDPFHARLFKNYMVTVSQFKSIVQELYDDGFVLIDSRLLYTIENGHVHKPDLYIPKGKKPLVLSLDDLNYYETMKGDGLAKKLVLDSGKIKTAVLTPEGNTIITSDGDVVPILDVFIAEHPDFSYKGARGIIGVTGYDGILGYRTQMSGAEGDKERQSVVPIVDALKHDGWIFASHSYSHSSAFPNGKISTTTLASDIAAWKKEVEPLVGTTDIFIGPGGQTFKDGDFRRNQLLAAGFKILYGVGLDEYVRYFDSYVMMDRVDIDGYRLLHNQKFLQSHFNI